MKLAFTARHILVGALFAAGIASASAETWSNLTSDLAGVAHFQDSNLVNPWGLVPGYEAYTTWVADNATGKVTRYYLNGYPFIPNLATGGTTPEVYNIPGGSPSGLILDHWAYHPELHPNEFLIKGTDNKLHPSRLLLCTEKGTICGINPDADPANAIQGYPNAGHSGNVGDSYTGLAIAQVNESGAFKHRLFAANFGQGTIDVFEDDFTPVPLSSLVTASNQHPFVDPNLPAGYKPYNIKRYTNYFPPSVTGGPGGFNRLLLVAYVNSTLTPPLPAQAGGRIDVFKVDGTFVTTLVDNSSGAPVAKSLNEPWGMEILRVNPLNPASHYLFFGNHNDGRIYYVPLAGLFTSNPPSNETPAPYLRPNGIQFQFDGLWALHFGRPNYGARHDAVEAADDDDLFESDGTTYLSAGIADESHGLVSRIRPGVDQ